MILQQVKVGKSVIFTGKFISAIIVMIQGQRSILISSKNTLKCILGSSRGKYDFYQTKQERSVKPFFV